MARLGTLVVLACVLLPGAATSALPPLNSQAITGFAFTPDGKTLLSASRDGRLRVHDGVTGKEQAVFDVPGRNLLGLAISPDGKRFATAGGDRVVRMWDLAPRKQLWQAEGHKGEVVAVAFSPDGRTLASGGYDATIRLWDAATGKDVKSWGVKGSRVTGLVFTPDGKTLASACTRVVPIAGLPLAGTDNARLWDVATGKEQAALLGLGTEIALGAGGRIAAVAGYQVEVVGPGQPAGIRINQVGLKPSLRVTLHDRLSNRELLRVDNAGGAVSLSADGRFLVTGRGTEMHVYGHSGVSIMGVAAPTRGMVLWEVQSGQAIRTLDPNRNGPTHLLLSPDGTRLATGGLDGTVRMLDLAPPGWDADRAKKAGPKEVELAWTDLAAKEPERAYAALWALSAAGDSSLKLLTEKLAPVKIDAEKIRKLVADLDARRFAMREAALKELQRMGFDAEPELRRLLKGQLTLEVRKRLEELIVGLDGSTPPAEAVRPLRAVVVLERLRLPEARKLLERLATGEPEARLTREAALALERLPRAP